MKSFEYTIKDELGIHARPAGILAKEAKKYESKITLTKDGKSVDVTRLMALMGLAVKCGNTVEVQVEGKRRRDSFRGNQSIFRRKSVIINGISLKIIRNGREKHAVFEREISLQGNRNGKDFRAEKR